ncbi:MAG TPA: LpqB family beta-propeller domain-containing protein [Streptosporangiaceae bacterium]
MARSAASGTRTPAIARGRAAAAVRRLMPSRARPAAVACLTALLAAACATVPDSGTVQRGQAAAAQPENFLQLIAVSPKPGWSPQQIVAGFLTASASFAGNHAVARQYLTPSAAGSWSPGPGVTVVGSPYGQGGLPFQAIRQPGQQDYEVKVQPTGQKLAFLTDNGPYANGNDLSAPYTFNVKQTGQGYRISNPPRFLMLNESDFQRVYQPRNLYFLADVGHALVPYPVFVPLQATSVGLATTLVTALLADPQEWLAGAARTAVPSGSRRVRPVTIGNGIATVDLGGAAATAGQTALQEMAAQLVWTLAGPSGDQPAIQSVQLEINGNLRASASWSGSQLTGSGRLTVPEMPARTTAYSIAPNGSVQTMDGDGSISGRVAGQAGDGDPPLSSIAVSLDGRYVAGLTGSGDVYFGPASRGARLEPLPRGGGFTSLSWDNQDNLWAAGSSGVWRQSGAGGVPSLVRGLAGEYQVHAFAVAPDDVRVALIVVPAGGGPAQLRLGAITRTGSQASVGQTVAIGSSVTDPTDLTWYDADHLIVLTSSPSAASPLVEVPVNGGTATNINTYPGTSSISAAGPGNPLLAGLPDGRLAVAGNINGSWTLVREFAGDPTYPG